MDFNSCPLPVAARWSDRETWNPTRRHISWASTRHCTKFSRSSGVQSWTQYQRYRYVLKCEWFCFRGNAIYTFSTYNCRYVGLIELPDAIGQPWSPIKFPPKCEHLHAGNELVLAAGNGLSKVNGTPLDRRLRHALFVTMPSQECKNRLGVTNGIVRRVLNPSSVICAEPSDEHQAVYNGDSGKYGQWKWSIARWRGNDTVC